MPCSATAWAERRPATIASDLAAKTYVSELRQKLKLSRQKKPDARAMMAAACHVANHMVYAYSCFDTDYTGMGTTLVSAVICGEDTFVLNVGDSRAYKLTKRKLTQVTKDHSLVQDMVDRGEITAEEARYHPRRNVITRALGVDENVPCDIFKVRLARGERLLLCSDGLTNMLEDREIFELSKENTDPLSLGRALMDKALDAGASDNVTIVILSK